MHPSVRRLLLLACILWLAACATVPPGPRNPRDPWERMNRTTYKFNDALDRAIIKPVAKGYVKVPPQWSRTGINNFSTNLTYPVVIVNDLLQWQIRAFFNDTGRLVHEHHARVSSASLIRPLPRAWTRTTAISARRSACGA